MTRVNEVIMEMNEIVSMLKARHGVRTRRRGVRRTILENLVLRTNLLRGMLGRKRRGFLGRIEREWWMERINECKEAYARR